MFINHQIRKGIDGNIFGDCIDISTHDDSYWLHPVHLRDRLTKISLATEEIYLYAREKRRQHTEK